jgi:hypothetical protein
VALNTGDLPQWNWTFDQQGPGHPASYKLLNYFNILPQHKAVHGVARVIPFLPGGKICRLQFAKGATVIASREYGLY